MTRCVERLALLFSTVVTFAFIVVIELRQIVGPRNFRNIVLGRYHTPWVEDRFFLFIDIVGSTGLAERIGAPAVHRFLAAVFRIASEPIADHKGEIYQYVSDEMVVTWTLGVRPSNHGSRGPRPVGVDNAAMAKTFRPYDRDQLRLMPPALADWVPDGHLARFVSDLVDDLDLTAIEDTYAEERGYPPYHPRMMVTVRLYAYCTGTYSSRKIAARLEDSVAFRFLAAENRPDFRTISDFRRRHSAALADLFTQVLRVCRQAGLVRLGRVAIDGTRMKANASKHKAMSDGRMVEKDAALQQEIADLLRRAEQIDRDEDAQHGPDRRGDELPAELARRDSRRQKIREAKAALEAEAREQAARAGKDPTQATPHPKAQRNLTDPESKIQKTADGFIQGYNAQAAVDATAQVIVAHDVTSMAADVGHLLPLVAAIGRTLRQRPRQVLADAGYCSEENLQRLAETAIDPYIATGRQQHTEWQAPAPRGRPPAKLTRRERVVRKLRTVKGRAVYACRKAIVEPVFGQIKQARGFRQFLRRGQTAVQHEWALLCTVHNLLKLYTASAHA